MRTRAASLISLGLVLALSGCTTGGASQSPGPTIGPTGAASQSVVATTTSAGTATTLGGGEVALDAGTYRLDLAAAPNIKEPGWPKLRITVPAGWTSLDGWALHATEVGSPTVAVQFWDVSQVYGDPCNWSGTLFRPGSTVDDLVQALVARTSRKATPPVNVTLDGFSGKYLEWSVPAAIDFSTCDAVAGTHYFESWVGPSSESDRWQQGPGQVDRLWILDVNGHRVVIDAFEMPSTTAAQRQELLDVVKSIKFER